ncbi:MAG: hypothetical protein K2Y51_03440 [Gammaproteobacteria bacterium]|jgi:hypothetical protein|nr:hypothetical protein [Gammaproteobacteria bacterium]
MAYQRPGPVISAWWRLWFPPLMILVVLAARVIDRDFYFKWIISEQGLVELATPVAALVGLMFGVRVLRHLKRSGSRDWLLGGWVLGVTLACFYLAGEELSWGQQLFHWQTPEAIDALNDQGETNLHNMSSWLDQKPRTLLEIWVVIGGIVIPVREKVRGTRYLPGTRGYWLWPTADCLPTAVWAELSRAPQRMKHLFGIQQLPIEIRWSEPQEFYFALFLALFLASLWYRLNGREHPPGQDPR